MPSGFFPLVFSPRQAVFLSAFKVHVLLLRRAPLHNGKQEILQAENRFQAELAYGV
jgi:hypothetical protein